jgi:hypothetical protein
MKRRFVGLRLVSSVGGGRRGSRIFRVNRHGTRALQLGIIFIKTWSIRHRRKIMVSRGRSTLDENSLTNVTSRSVDNVLTMFASTTSVENALTIIKGWFHPFFHNGR